MLMLLYCSVHPETLLFTAPEPLGASKHCYLLRRSHLALEMAARASQGAARALGMTAQARLGAARALEMGAQAWLGSRLNARNGRSGLHGWRQGVRNGCSGLPRCRQHAQNNCSGMLWRHLSTRNGCSKALFEKTALCCTVWWCSAFSSARLPPGGLESVLPLLELVLAGRMS